MAICLTVGTLQSRLVHNCHYVCILLLNLLNIVSMTVSLLVIVTPALDLFQMLVSLIRHSIASQKKTKFKLSKPTHKDETDSKI